MARIKSSLKIFILTFLCSTLSWGGPYPNQGGTLRIGSRVLNGTPQSILYIDNNGNLAESADFYFDGTTVWLNGGINISSQGKLVPAGNFYDGVHQISLCDESGYAARMFGASSSFVWPNNTVQVSSPTTGGGGGINIGDPVGGGTAYSILYVDASGNLKQYNSNFAFVDDGVDTQLIVTSAGIYNSIVARGAWGSSRTGIEIFNNGGAAIGATSTLIFKANTSTSTFNTAQIYSVTTDVSTTSPNANLYLAVPRNGVMQNIIQIAGSTQTVSINRNLVNFTDPLLSLNDNSQNMSAFNFNNVHVSANTISGDFSLGGSIVARITAASNQISLAAGSGSLGTTLLVDNSLNQVSVRNSLSSNPLLLKFDSSTNDGTITWTPADSQFSIPNTKLTGSISYSALTTKTTHYTLTTSDNVVLASATSVGLTLTLPTAVSQTGLTYLIKKIDLSTGSITIATNSSQKIDDSTQTYKLTQPKESHIFISDGSNWRLF